MKKLLRLLYELFTLTATVFVGGYLFRLAAGENGMGAARAAAVAYGTIAVLFVAGAYFFERTELEPVERKPWWWLLVFGALWPVALWALYKTVRESQREEEADAQRLPDLSTVVACTNCGSLCRYLRNGRGFSPGGRSNVSWCPACAPGAPWPYGPVLSESCEAIALRKKEAKRKGAFDPTPPSPPPPSRKPN